MIQLPHWQVDGERFNSQFLAWRTASRKNTKPSFYFYEEEYDKLNWTQEPKESWDDICYERCFVLRERYKKLSLMYSAGRDSHHILRCFLKFKIPLDELIILKAHFLSTNKKIEFENYIVPQAKKFLEYFPQCKITVLEDDSSLYENYFKNDFLEKKNSAFANGMFITTLPFRLSAIKHDLHDNGFIFGVDKPRILLEDGKYYSTVIDKTIEFFMADFPNVEFFYYAPDMPKIHLKQSWMLLNHLEKNYADITSDFLIDYCGNSFSDKYDELCIASGRGPAWNVGLDMQNGKNKYKGAGHSKPMQDVLKYELSTNLEAAWNYRTAMQEMQEKYSHIFNNNDPLLGTIGIYAKKYYMKDAK
jgi:hypothetical protein